ncbi:hypothetical protein [Paragemmobacter straminiformis]|uniref:Uncharacterized protein n=1 Tax=Paragemmobacter straminiformis TaxID=2045119 RepID=A0A842I6U7_9RHOB|nr:hypothetical protein [Gemmobacter straminiformis]MBC2834688.1 hypothetical protein [Gemmobacter straminiformis]
MMARRNFIREVRHLIPKPTPDHRDAATVHQLATARAVQAVRDLDPTLSSDDAEMVTRGLRLAFDTAVETARRHWIGGVPSSADLSAIRRRLCRSFGLTGDELDAALTGHPMPATVD